MRLRHDPGSDHRVSGRTSSTRPATRSSRRSVRALHRAAAEDSGRGQPASLMAFDLLADPDGSLLRSPLHERRAALERAFAEAGPEARHGQADGHADLLAGHDGLIEV